jgi:hypothetical protein
MARLPAARRAAVEQRHAAKPNPRVEVNEARIYATRRGLDWWVAFRVSLASTTRITVLLASVGGDLVDVACDSSGDAAWLLDHMISEGVPAHALKVRQ